MVATRLNQKRREKIAPKMRISGKTIQIGLVRRMRLVIKTLVYSSAMKSISRLIASQKPAMAASSHWRGVTCVSSRRYRVHSSGASAREVSHRRMKTITSDGMPSLCVKRIAIGVMPAEKTMVRMMSSRRFLSMPWLGPPRKCSRNASTSLYAPLVLRPRLNLVAKILDQPPGEARAQFELPVGVVMDAVRMFF